MTTPLLILSTIVLVVLLLFRILHRKKRPTAGKKKLIRESKPNLSQHKTTPRVVTEASPVQAPDVGPLLQQVDVLIQEQEFARAEGLINLSLNHYADSPPLYFKLLEIYQLQQDDLAIKQLFDMVARLNFNALFQKLHTVHEEFLAEQRVLISTPAAKSTPIPEPSTTSDPASPAQPSSPELNHPAAYDVIEYQLDPAVLSATPDQNDTFVDLNLKPSAAPLTASPASQLSEHNAQHLALANAFEATLSPHPEPVEMSALARSALALSQDASASVEFRLAPTPDTTPQLAEQQLPEFLLDFNLSLEPEAERSDPPLARDTITPVTDPLLVNFPVLATLDTVELDLQLVQHYIQLGAFQAAKQLLGAQQQPLTAEQALKFEELRKAIA
jgi:hypothetical protein